MTAVWVAVAGAAACIGAAAGLGLVLAVGADSVTLNDVASVAMVASSRLATTRSYCDIIATKFASGWSWNFCVARATSSAD